MYCIVTYVYAAGIIRSYLRSVVRYTILVLDNYRRSTVVGKDMRIRGYFLKPRWVRKQKIIWETPR
jgi:hypothetical protein